ncbi:MAG: hypothetical protein P1U35_05915 [Cycloclasticus sp.]|nr:hypothetical protein [Cycloclasticus sp.]
MDCFNKVFYVVYYLILVARGLIGGLHIIAIRLELSDYQLKLFVSICFGRTALNGFSDIFVGDEVKEIRL